MRIVFFVPIHVLASLLEIAAHVFQGIMGRLLHIQWHGVASDEDISQEDESYDFRWVSHGIKDTSQKQRGNGENIMQAKTIKLTNKRPDDVRKVARASLFLDGDTGFADRVFTQVENISNFFHTK